MTVALAQSEVTRRENSGSRVRPQEEALQLLNACRVPVADPQLRQAASPRVL